MHGLSMLHYLVGLSLGLCPLLASYGRLHGFWVLAQRLESCCLSIIGLDVVSVEAESFTKKYMYINVQ